MKTYPYIGRFAPSPTGILHRGSLVAAMASFLDAKAYHGQWLVRIEDLDEARTVPGAAEEILRTLRFFGMTWNGTVVRQSERHFLYEAALDRLKSHVYQCGCTRREVVDSRIGIASDGASVYPGTCRYGMPPGKTARAYRLRVPESGEDRITFEDRWMGRVTQALATEVGDFVLKRADGFWAYQLAVVVDDADQGVTQVVRGADLLESTPRQIYLQRLLGIPTPTYLHIPVVINATGEKLSKQTGATPLDFSDPISELRMAAAHLSIPIGHVDSIDDFWRYAINAWSNRFGPQQEI